MSEGSLKKARALFLDRDGVINIDKGYVFLPEDCEFVPGIFDLCRDARSRGFKLIVITNQSGIARGYFTEKDFLNLMEFIKARFAQEGCPLDDFFFCPFHPAGLAPYNKTSPDRKPAPGMIFKAAAKYGLDLARSVLVGDKSGDIEAGRNAGVGCNILTDGKSVPPTLIQLLDCQARAG